MQYINLNKTIDLEKNIVDLLLINIDDQINIIDDKDGIKISGTILIGCKVKTIEGDEEINDNISLDLFLMHEEVVERNLLNVSVTDFTYEIKEEKLLLNISLKIDGLKEIDTSFLAKEDSESFQEEIEDDEKFEDIKTKVKENSDHNQNEGNKDKYIEVDIDINDRDKYEENKEDHKPIEKTNLLEEMQMFDDSKSAKIEKKSLLKSVFLSRKINEEVSWKLHCVKAGETYENIAKKYNINLNNLILLNNEEKLEEGKLIFLPLD